MFNQELLDHLGQGVTTLARVWSVTRTDGQHYGFTDHDSDLAFDGQQFRASTGLSAKALQQSTGLSVDNTEAVGALSDAGITEEDLAAGRFDRAEVRSWLVNWADVTQRVEQFRGSFGEVTRVAGSFRVELRGLSEGLNQPQGRAYQRGCSAVLGDAACGVDLTAAGLRLTAEVAGVDALDHLVLTGAIEPPEGWFERGQIKVLSGRAAGLVGMIKSDDPIAAGRIVALWHDFAVPLALGDLVELTAGCDRAAQTCRTKFDNFVNFRGFPHIPGEDWLTSYPTSASQTDGGSLFR